MPSTSTSNVTSIRNFQEEHLGRSVGEIVDQLRQQHAQIDEMISRLMRCLSVVQIVEKSLESSSPLGSIDGARKTLIDAQVVLKHISRQLDDMGFPLP